MRWIDCVRVDPDTTSNHNVTHEMRSVHSHETFHSNVTGHGYDPLWSISMQNAANPCWNIQVSADGDAWWDISRTSGGGKNRNSSQASTIPPKVIKFLSDDTSSVLAGWHRAAKP